MLDLVQKRWHRWGRFPFSLCLGRIQLQLQSVESRWEASIWFFFSFLQIAKKRARADVANWFKWRSSRGKTSRGESGGRGPLDVVDADVAVDHQRRPDHQAQANRRERERERERLGARPPEAGRHLVLAPCAIDDGRKDIEHRSSVSTTAPMLCHVVDRTSSGRFHRVSPNGPLIFELDPSSGVREIVDSGDRSWKTPWNGVFSRWRLHQVSVHCSSLSGWFPGHVLWTGGLQFATQGYRFGWGFINNRYRERPKSSRLSSLRRRLWWRSSEVVAHHDDDDLFHLFFIGDALSDVRPLCYSDVDSRPDAGVPIITQTPHSSSLAHFVNRLEKTLDQKKTRYRRCCKKKSNEVVFILMSQVWRVSFFIASVLEWSSSATVGRQKKSDNRKELNLKKKNYEPCSCKTMLNSFVV